MILAHCADLHIDETRRLSDTEHVLSTLIGGAKEAAVDLIVVAGDWFERDSTEAERRVMSDFLMAATEIAPVVGIKGNHEISFDRHIMSRQRTKFPVMLYDRPTLIGESPIITTPHGAVGVVCLPWFTRAGVAARLAASSPSDEITFAVNQAATSLLMGAAMEVQRFHAAGAIAILVHHGTVTGAKFSSGFVPRGLTVGFSAEQLAETGADYVALGHYHDGETNVWLDGRVAYSGSTERCDFGEAESKGFRLVTFDGGRFTRNEFIELPARRIELLEADWTDPVNPIPLAETITQFHRDFNAGQLTGALVRFRYRVRAQDLHLVDEEAIRRALIEAGAHEVKVEAVVEAESRVRCEAITTAETLWDEVVAWCGATGKELDAEQRVRLREKLAEVEAGGGA